MDATMEMISSGLQGENDFKKRFFANEKNIIPEVLRVIIINSSIL